MKKVLTGLIATLMVLATIIGSTALATDNPMNNGWQYQIEKLKIEQGQNEQGVSGEEDVLQIGEKCKAYERPWGYIGWGQGGAVVRQDENGTYYKDVICFIPGSDNEQEVTSTPTPTSEPEPVCETRNETRLVEKEWVCKWKRHHKHCGWEYTHKDFKPDCNEKVKCNGWFGWMFHVWRYCHIVPKAD